MGGGRPEPSTFNTLNESQYKSSGLSVLFIAFQYFVKNLAYYAPFMLILESKLRAYLQYFASKISTSTEEAVRLEVLSGRLRSRLCLIDNINNLVCLNCCKCMVCTDADRTESADTHMITAPAALAVVM